MQWAIVVLEIFSAKQKIMRVSTGCFVCYLVSVYAVRCFFFASFGTLINFQFKYAIENETMNKYYAAVLFN